MKKGEGVLFPSPPCPSPPFPSPPFPSLPHSLTCLPLSLPLLSIPSLPVGTPACSGYREGIHNVEFTMPRLHRAVAQSCHIRLSSLRVYASLTGPAACPARWSCPSSLSRPGYINRGPGVCPGVAACFSMTVTDNDICQLFTISRWAYGRPAPESILPKRGRSTPVSGTFEIHKIHQDLLNLVSINRSPPSATKSTSIM